MVAASLVLSLAGTATAAGAPRRAPTRHPSPTISRTRWRRSSLPSSTQGPREGPQGQVPSRPATTRSSRWRRASTSSWPARARIRSCTILGEFGDGRSTRATHGGHGGTPGPLHNEIPEPDRRRGQHDDLDRRLQRGATTRTCCSARPPAPSRCATTTSSSRPNRYSGERRRHAVGQGRRTTRQAMARTTAATSSARTRGCFVERLAGRVVQRADRSDDRRRAQRRICAPFDVWDRYDLDGDGELRRAGRLHRPLPVGPCRRGRGDRWRRPGHRRHLEPPLVRLAASQRPDGPGRRSSPRSAALRIGNSDYWIGDYTVEPENGGVGVFAHEFGHDLGLPDLYDTSGNTGGAENSTGFWTLYELRLVRQHRPARGRHRQQAGPHGQLREASLGWLNYEVAFAGAPSQHKLGPSEAVTKQAQGVFVILPDQASSRSTWEIRAPRAVRATSTAAPVTTSTTP